jgi:hypothetical protein
MSELALQRIREAKEKRLSSRRTSYFVIQQESLTLQKNKEIPAE